MFNKRSIDWEKTARGLARSSSNEKLTNALRGGYIDAHACAELRKEIPYRSPEYTQPNVTRANIEHRQPSMLGLWQKIRASSQRAENARASGEGWFSASR